MKIEKGQPGYLKAQRNKLLLQLLIEAGIIITLLITGYIIHKTKLNWFTLVAVLGCLPAAKVMVGVIAIAPYPGIEASRAQEIAAQSVNLTVAYDLVVTSRETIMPVDAVVISERTVCGYAGHKKAKPEAAADHIKHLLEEEHITKVTVKIFADYKAFLSRAEGMNSIAQIEQPESKRRERKIRSIILSSSM